MSDFAAMMLVALLIDSAFGWPAALYARIGHPVTWIGALISACDARLNDGRHPGGFVTVAAVCLVAALPALAAQAVLPGGWPGWLIGGVLAWPLVAARSLHDHVAAVATPLARGDLAAARRAVAMIVGRDPDRLDGPGVARAAIESLAENTSDGVTAPLFWGAVLGLPGIAVYKAINTMDSMIGHRTPRHAAFGMAAARLDDLVNLLPARLTGGLFALVSSAPRRSWAVMLRDAGLHRSPNAGWPEGAMAGALGVRLSGPRSYAEGQVDEPWVNAGAPDPGGAEIGAGLALYRRAVVLLGVMLAGVALAASALV